MKLQFVALSLLLFSGCSTAKLVGTWKNPDHVIFDAYKVLVVGMAKDENVRMDFESKLVKKLEDKGVEAMRSIDIFDVEFTTSQKSEEELSEVEEQLLDKDFDAILFTKILKADSKRTLKERINNIDRMFMRFSTDYLEHQDIYYDPESYDSFNIYHLETSLYCICIGKERELIWRGNIDVTESPKVEKTIDAYIKLITDEMERQDIIFY
ncbi:hypothetical protein F8C76_14980 [Flagellimonas olearia]|uniref:Cardiolipin synthetase n=1 Tax=Flagellimonas olearia TaxID=552546 RepID=A0A6I1E0J8_9FLAO|nr:hypothetical protein [Allomuricauda olearia]KAB7529137.1 hypothetical protein F8C76_14980 [Allomuricauda olearia]